MCVTPLLGGCVADAADETLGAVDFLAQRLDALGLGAVARA
jgi:hypothetical protein